MGRRDLLFFCSLFFPPPSFSDFKALPKVELYRLPFPQLPLEKDSFFSSLFFLFHFSHALNVIGIRTYLKKRSS